NVWIADNEPRVWVGNASVLEGNEGTAPAVFTVSLSSAYDRPVTVTYGTADGSAVAGGDFTATSGAVAIAAGQLSQDIMIPVQGDRLIEPAETFTVRLSTPDAYALLGNDTAGGTITDNEPHLSIADAYQDYYGSSITFAVTLVVPYDE